MATYSVQDLKEALDHDYKLLGHIEDENNDVKSKILTKKDVTSMVYYNPHTVIVNANTFFRVSYIKSKLETTIVDEVTKHDINTRYIDIIIDNSLADKVTESMEDLITEFILLSKIICNIAKVNCEFNVTRFKTVQEFKTKVILPKDNLKLVFSTKKEIDDVCEQVENCICIGYDLDKLNTNKLAILELIRRLHISNIKVDTLCTVYEAYCSGDIPSHDIAMWSRAHNDFFYQGEPKYTKYGPEVIAKCKSTDYIANYVTNAYYTRLSTKRNYDAKLDASLKELVADYHRHYNDILQDYIKSMTKVYRDGPLQFSIIMDYNELLKLYKLELTDNHIIISRRGPTLAIFARYKFMIQSLVSSSVIDEIKRELCEDGFMLEGIIVG